MQKVRAIEEKQGQFPHSTIAGRLLSQTMTAGDVQAGHFDACTMTHSQGGFG
jgi:hypothetical protein